MKRSRMGARARKALAASSGPPPAAMPTVQVPLPLLTVLAEATTAFFGLCLSAGQQTLMEQDRERTSATM